MIKLIASDLDGTLLYQNGQLPEGTLDVITHIMDSGVLFIPASGRQYESLKAIFPTLVEKTPFICENGALIKYLGATIHLDPIPLESVKRILSVLKTIPNVHVIYCGEKTAFVDSDYKPFFLPTTIAYPCHQKVDNLNDIIGIEPCCKLALYSTVSSREQAYPAILPHLDDTVSAMLSGSHWCDILSKTANKGEALKVLQTRFGITQDESIAFGDHLNDYELLTACKTSFAPENAQPEIKAIATHVIPSNADMGVTNTLKRLFLEGKN